MDRTGKEDFVNNSSYYFVALLPLLGVFLKNKTIYLILYAISMFFVISAAKRGALLTFSVGSIIAFYFLLIDSKMRNRIIRTTLVLYGIVIIAYFAYSQFREQEFFQFRIEQAFEGNSSGREYIYSDIFYGWYNSGNIWNLFFGYGFVGSLKLTSNFAHNDWLEILAGYGFVGFLLYFIIISGLLKYYIKHNQLMNSQEKQIFLVTTCIWIVQSLFSSVYGGLNTYVYTLSLAFIMGSVDGRIVKPPLHLSNQKHIH
jgi:O-antigen ligase